MASPDKKKDAERPSRWRDHIEAATMAIVVAVMLKYFVVEAYQIPSGSMQPTLMGSPEAGIFDRILVDKLSYHFRDPERWEVVVFKYPLDRSKSFIKRLVGMPGEDLMIRFGDLWRRQDASQPWQILRRPDPVQREVWRRIDRDDPRYSKWKPDAGALTWAIHGREGFEARGTGSLRLPAEGPSVIDSYYDGYPGKMVDLLKRSERIRLQVPHSRSDVGDLRLEGRVSAHEGLKSFALELREGDRVYSFTLPGPKGTPAAQPWSVKLGATPKPFPDQPDSRVVTNAWPGADWRLPAGKRTSFAVQNMDDLLRLEIDGRTVLEIEIPAAQEQRSSVTVRVDGDADFEGLELFRDIYYTEMPEMQTEFHIGPGQYVMMGDNTQDSSDSREWKFVEYKWNEAEGGQSSARGNLRGNNENPALVSEPGGARVFFRDEWGERHTFPVKSAIRVRDYPAPFVPRELITGRAVLVFWPMAPTQNVWRLQWVH